MNIMDKLTSPLEHASEHPSSYPSANIAVCSLSYSLSENPQINALEAAVFAEALRDAADALCVVQRSISILSKNSQALPTKPRRKLVRKYGTDSSADERRMIYAEEAGYVPVILSVDEKLNQNRFFAYNAFHKIAHDFECNNGCYNWLRNAVNQICKTRENNQFLEINYKIWLELADVLRESQKKLIQEFHTRKQTFLLEISKITAEIDRSYCINTEHLDYKIKWDASKLDQQNFRLKLYQENIKNKIKELHKARKADNQASEAILCYESRAISYFENEIFNWTTRYNKELEFRQQEANNIEEKMKEIEQFLEESVEIYESRRIIVDEYLGKQQAMQGEEAYWEEIHKAATIIQTIWRGYMVRHFLGPYKNLGKEKKSKKKSKKKRKKKLKKIK